MGDDDKMITVSMAANGFKECIVFITLYDEIPEEHGGGYEIEDRKEIACAEAETIPLAICLAAIKVIEGDVKILMAENG